MEIKKISFAQAHEILQARPETVMLDVREEPEYLSGHAVSAMLLPVDEINDETASALIPDHDTPIIVYCRTGRRSAMAADALMACGYTEIYDVGGLIGWPYGTE